MKNTKKNKLASFAKNQVKTGQNILGGKNGDAVNTAIIDTGIDYDFLPEPFLYN